MTHIYINFFKARNCKINSFSIDNLLGKTNPSRTTMNIKFFEKTFPKVSANNFSVQEFFAIPIFFLFLRKELIWWIYIEMELSASNIQVCESSTTSYTLDALQSTDGRSKRRKELRTDKEVRLTPHNLQ